MADRNNKGQFIKGHMLGVRFGAGQKMGEEFRFKKGHETWNKGLHIRTASKVWEKGNVPWNKGKKLPYIPHYNQRGKLLGSKHPNWKGGKTAEYKTERILAMDTFEYKLWRKAVFERDNYICQMCDESGSNLQADHIKPWALFPELRFAIDNGRTLCKSCHKLKSKMDWQEYDFYKTKEVN